MDPSSGELAIATLEDGRVLGTRTAPSAASAQREMAVITAAWTAFLQRVRGLYLKGMPGTDVHAVIDFATDREIELEGAVSDEDRRIAL